jgi:hypothetical protein
LRVTTDGNSVLTLQHIPASFAGDIWVKFNGTRQRCQ